jgi:predicted dehydrogenase
MGLSHLSLVRAHPSVELVGMCDSTRYIVDVLSKYTGLQGFGDYSEMLESTRPDAVVISTPTRFHFDMARAALEQGIHVFCEKPLALTSAQSASLASLAQERHLVSQVGYHNRFVSTFAEGKRLLDLGAIGRVTHVLAEAYGPVVLKPAGGTWRSRRSEGGGALYDYAAHPIDLLTWYLGAPAEVSGTSLRQVFSRETEDEVYANLGFESGATAHLSVNWSDDSVRKMTTRLTVWGERGQIKVDRQECHVYLRSGENVPAGYVPGWNTRNTTELTDPVWFYVRGEEYSAQMAHFVESVSAHKSGAAYEAVNDFAQGRETDRVIEMLLADAERSPSAPEARKDAAAPRARRRRRGWFRRTS